MIDSTSCEWRALISRSRSAPRDRNRISTRSSSSAQTRRRVSERHRVSANLARSATIVVRPTCRSRRRRRPGASVVGHAPCGSAIPTAGHPSRDRDERRLSDGCRTLIPAERGRRRSDSATSTTGSSALNSARRRRLPVTNRANPTYGFGRERRSQPPNPASKPPSSTVESHWRNRPRPPIPNTCSIWHTVYEQCTSRATPWITARPVVDDPPRNVDERARNVV